MNAEIKTAVLKLIGNSEVPWNWYKLDRALARQGMGGQCNVAELAQMLTDEGMLTTTSGDNEAMPTYTITEAGRKWLQSRS